MGVSVGKGTLAGGVTPMCEVCGIALCWDISEEEYEEQKRFWDDWKCEDCNGSRMSLTRWQAGLNFGSRDRDRDTLTSHR